MFEVGGRTSLTRSVIQTSLWARPFIQGLGVFLVCSGFLVTLAPSAPFTKELGVCESGAVRDVLAGHIVLPRFLPGPIVHVPPLYWWIAALWVKALGWNELAFRLPSLVAAALTCAIVFAWSSRTLSPRAGLWSAAALLLCHFFLDTARQPRMDSMLALFVTVAAVCLERALATGTSAKSPSTWYFVAAASAIGLGALTKGILGIVLPGLVVALFLLIRGRFGELFRFDLAATFAAGAAIGLAWFLAGYQLGGRPFLEWQLRMNLWSRFIPAGAGGASYCVHPFWYFVPQILSGFLPWSVYLPAFVLAAWPVARRRLPEPGVYALCWFAALLIFFSSSHGKCLIYILPAFPPLAILTGWTIAQIQTSADTLGWAARLLRVGSTVIGVGTALMVTAAMVAIGYGVPAKIAMRLHPTDRRFLELLVQHAFNPRLLLWAVFSLAGAGLAVGGLRRTMPALDIYGTLLIAAAGGWFWFAVMNPALARGETLKAFARQAAALVPDDTQIGHFGLGDCELNFYSPRPLTPVSQISCDAHAAAQYIIIRQDDFDAIPSTRRACFAPELAATPDDSIGPRLLLKRLLP
jgi:4-amino-4-deoxy-L-arabinose transferase-like glycosyltransferase